MSATRYASVLGLGFGDCGKGRFTDAVGVHDALAQLTIDAQCRVTTPYHQAAGRLRELLRGAETHGTCGVGVGETVRHALAKPDEALRYGDLPRGPVDKIQAIRETLLAELSPQCDEVAACRDELAVLRDEKLAEKWMTSARALARHCPPATAGELAARLRRPGCGLFEGAQGVLLDEWRGFHPHTTWSSTTTAAVERVAARFGICERIEHYGVLRSYLTRHGAGPLPTHDESLDALPEPHNHNDGWQGRFRRGHPDAVLLHYALDAVGNLTGLLISHLDVFDGGMALKWCERYVATGRLPLSDGEDLNHQLALTRLLGEARPEYASEDIRSAPALLERIASVTTLPVVLRSYGADTSGLRA